MSSDVNVAAKTCAECRTFDAPPKTWCDCLDDDPPCAVGDPCRLRAHDPADCPEVQSLSDALYAVSLEEILGVPDEALDEVARVILASPWLAARAEAAKADAVASMAALFRDIRAGHITPHEAAILCDLRANSYRALDSERRNGSADSGETVVQP